MSERHDDTTSHESLDLLDRAAEFAPHMSLEPSAVIAAGRRKVRRRRASAVGGGVAAVALAGGLWVAGPLSPFTDPDAVAPASVSWQDGVDVRVLDNEPHPSEVGRVHWQGDLVSAEGDTRPALVLTKDGEQLDPIPAEDGPGDVMIYRSANLAVAVWESPVGSSGEQLLWSPGSEWGQGGDFIVDGVELWYASAEFIPGAEPGLEEMYWFGEDAAHAASGAPVSSTVLTAGDTRAVVMVDEARGLWGTDARPTDQLVGNVHVATLRSGAGYTGWMPGTEVSPRAGDPAPAPRDVVPTSVGVLPPGASLSATTSATVELAQGTVGKHTVVLAADPERTLAISPPQISYTLGGRQHNLQSWVETGARTIEVDGAQVQVSGTPDGLQLFVGPGEFALIPDRDLDGDSVVVGGIGDGQVVLVPGWEPTDDVTGLRLQLGGDAQQWVEPDATLVGTLFDGSPLLVLALDEGTVQAGGAVEAVGTMESDTIVPLDLEGGVTEIDLGL